MKLLNFLLISSTALFCASALAGSGKPVRCPLVPNLQSEKITEAIQIQPGLYMTLSRSHYNTKEQWRFNMGPLTAGSIKEALREANRKLQAKLEGPLESSDTNNTIVCSYDTGFPAVIAIASPSADE